MADEVFVFDAEGAPFTLHTLAVILRVLNDNGEIVVKGVLPGSVSLLTLGATLAQIARQELEIPK